MIRRKTSKTKKSMNQPKQASGGGGCQLSVTIITGLFLILGYVVNQLKNNTFISKTMTLQQQAVSRDIPSTSKAAADASVPTLKDNGNDPFSSSNYGRPIHPILKRALAKTSGEGWDLNPKSSMESEFAKQNNLQCHWIDFVATSGKTAKFCGHDENDLVTRKIRKTKRWPDCDVLPKFWNDQGLIKDSNSVYIEIGANIGGCVMEMLLSTDAKIVAFEPHPINQFMLQNSIQALPLEYQERFVLVPVGLGKEESKNEIFSSVRNMGNSVIGTIVKDFGSQKDEDFLRFNVFVERLSSIININDENLNVPLIKLDAQGYECNILEGVGQKMASKIKKIKFEVARKWLVKQGCIDLFDRFRSLGFEIESENGKEKFPTGNNYGGGIKEFVAFRN